MDTRIKRTKIQPKNLHRHGSLSILGRMKTVENEFIFLSLIAHRSTENKPINKSFGFLSILVHVILGSSAS